MTYIMIKQVPNNNPNAEGEWVRVKLHPNDVQFLNRKRKFRSFPGEILTQYCGPGMHAVQYSLGEEVNNPYDF